MSETQTVASTPDILTEVDKKSYVDRKWQIAYGILIDYKSPNLRSAAHILYDSLFHPEDIIAKYGIPESETFPDQNDELARRITLPDIEVPNEGEFVEKICDLVTREYEDFEKVLYPDAIESLEQIASRYPSFIWTEGDASDKESAVYATEDMTVAPLIPEGATTTFEQLRKLIGSGVSTMRKNLGAVAIDEDTVSVNPRDKLGIIAENDKFAPEVVDRIVAFCKERGLDSIAILDDRIKNLERISTLLEERGMTALPLWVRQGHRSGAGECRFEAYREFVSIKDAADFLASMKSDGDKAFAHAGALVDYDGTLSDQSARSRLQKKHVFEYLKKNHYI